MTSQAIDANIELANIIEKSGDISLVRTLRTVRLVDPSFGESYLFDSSNIREVDEDSVMTILGTIRIGNYDTLIVLLSDGLILRMLTNDSWYATIEPAYD